MAPQRFARYWLPVLAYVALIFILSSMSHLRPPLHFANADKVIHACEYAILGLLLVRALRTLPPTASLLAAGAAAIVIGMGIGAADETYQRGVPGRDSSPLDWVADTLGLSLAQTGYAWAKWPKRAPAAPGPPSGAA